MAKHQDLAAEYAHIPGYYQAGDPGAIGPGKLWIDTSGGTGLWALKLRNSTDDGWEVISGGSGFTDHGVLIGLGDDDHAQYHNNARGDARYSLLAHTHLEADITDLQAYLTEVAADLLYAELAHTHTESDITDLQNYSLVGHTHAGLYAPLSHTHVESDITDLQAYLTEAAADLLYEPLGGGSGVYLPLTAGVGSPVTGDLYIGAGFKSNQIFNLEYLGPQSVGGDDITISIGGGSGRFARFGNPNYTFYAEGDLTRPKYNNNDLALLSDVGGGGVTDHGALTGLGDDDHAQYHNNTRGDARYSLLGHGHAIGEITGFTPGDYLLKAGGIMSGNLQFSDDGEGVQFWDNDSAYFNALTMNLTDGVIELGGDAVGLGGYPPIRQKTVISQIGLNGAGATFLTMWDDTGGDFLPALTQYDGGDFEVGNVDHAINLLGSEARPAYNGANLALFTDVPAGAYDPEAVPRMQIGSGYCHAAFITGIVVDTYAPGAPGAAVRISPRDFIRFIRGGTTVLEYKMEIPSWNPGPIGTTYNVDPTTPLDLTDMNLNVPGTIAPVRVYVRDSFGNETFGECFLIVTDNNFLI